MLEGLAARGDEVLHQATKVLWARASESLQSGLPSGACNPNVKNNPCNSPTNDSATLPIVLGAV